MPTLDSTLRDQLATVIGKENAETGARAPAEAGARAAIEALAVHLPAPYAHLDTAAKALRNQLRARARQLGDVREADGTHRIGRLVEQMAYEHWHRMLFARFLAENELLIHPQMGVAVSLSECAELAPSEGAVDGWELAGRYASRMLPQIFRPDDALLAVRFALDDVKRLEDLLDSLPGELFRASDSLGWCYQFWQAKKKKEVNASEVKIGADELPAVTQLFTEPYMVQFLLHNTLGAWWVGAGRTLPLEMPFLRFLDDGAPAAGKFEGWPRLARELKVLDPCCGSGHFLVAAFEILVAFRMAEEGLSAREACDAVLRDNLFGLEIDARCVQIAAFALAMAAWTYPGAGGYRPLAGMNVACSGLAISAKKEEWERLGGDNARLRAGMGRMWELFRDAPVVGSLIDPKKDAPNPVQVARFEEVAPMLAQALEASSIAATLDPDRLEATVTARGMANAAAILGSSFTLICTNVPYLAWGSQHPTLQLAVDRTSANGRHDLATAFIVRALGLCGGGGTVALVTPQNWLYQDFYRAFRKGLLQEQVFRVVAWLGSGAFSGISGEVVKPALIVLDAGSPGPGASGVGIDLDAANYAQKVTGLANGDLTPFVQRDQMRNPAHVVTLHQSPDVTLLGDYFDYGSGIQSGDFPRFGRKLWELPVLNERWVRQQTTVSDTVPFGGMTNAFLWEAGSGEFYKFVAERLGDGGTAAWIRGSFAWGRAGIAISPTGAIKAALYTGELFDDNTIVLIPKAPETLAAGWLFCSSGNFNEAVRKIDKALKVRGALVKVPFDLPYWTSEARRQLPNGLPAPNADDPTQWAFHGNPSPSEAPLQVGIARLLGYRWPDQQPDALDTHADTDGIVCIPALRGERPAADRLTDLLAAAWGSDWHPQVLTDLLAAVGHKGKLDEWLRDAFFRQHCELFHHRPFIWHIWDGHREGFSALVNYHKLDHDTLKSLTYSYLGDWIRDQEAEAKAGKSGAGDKLAKAKTLQQRLAAILEGEAPLDIFVRWKPLEKQPIGWHPDLDDGVRLNIRPFLTVADVGAKGAGVLRWKPNIKWGIDRGKNPPGAPWGEDRDNDNHLTLAQKRAARGQ